MTLACDNKHFLQNAPGVASCRKGVLGTTWEPHGVRHMHQIIFNKRISRECHISMLLVSEFGWQVAPTLPFFFSQVFNDASCEPDIFGPCSTGITFHEQSWFLISVGSTSSYAPALELLAALQDRSFARWNAPRTPLRSPRPMRIHLWDFHLF